MPHRRACAAFLASISVERLESVRVPHLRAFLAAEAQRRPAPSSEARTVAALRCFFRFCVENEYIARDVACAAHAQAARGAARHPSRGELRRLLSAPGQEGVWQRSFAGREQRDRLLLALFAHVLRIRHGKGGRQRTVPLHLGLVGLLEDYLATRLPLGSERALFVGTHGGASTTILATTFRRYARAAVKSRDGV